MYFNPYAQGGWSNLANAHGVNNGPWEPSNPPAASVYGALPFASASASAPEAMLRFVFKYETTILDSIVWDPRKRPYYRVKEDAMSSRRTVFMNTDNTTFATLEWRPAPSTVEINGLVEKQSVASWLPLSQDRSQRGMYARNTWYAWIPREDSIQLFAATRGSAAPVLCARMTRGDKYVILEMTPRAVQIGLVEFCIVATVVLQSGCNIE